MNQTALLIRVIVLILFILALICAAAPTTIAGAGWPVWALGGVIAWALEPFITGTKA